MIIAISFFDLERHYQIPKSSLHTLSDLLLKFQSSWSEVTKAISA